MEEIHRIWTPGFRPVSGSASLRGPQGLSHPERSINNSSQMNIKHLKKIFFLNWIPVLSSGNNLKLSFSLKWGLKRFVIHWNLLFIGERSNGKQRRVVSLNRMKLWDETNPSYTFTLTLFGYFNHNFRSYLHWKYKFSFGKTFKNKKVYPPSQHRRQKWSTFFSPDTLTTMLQTPTTVMVWIGGFFLCHWAQSSNTKSSSLNKRW